MAFTIDFYNNSSETEKVDKDLSSHIQLTGNLKAESSVIDPTIIINASAMPPSNYMYIGQFNRYYFINNITSIRDGLWQISAHVDVLMTYKSQIRACTALIDRQEYSFNPYLPDDMVPLSNDNRQMIYKFSNGKEFNTNNIILAVNAGSVKEEG